MTLFKGKNWSYSYRGCCWDCLWCFFNASCLFITSLFSLACSMFSKKKKIFSLYYNRWYRLLYRNYLRLFVILFFLFCVIWFVVAFQYYRHQERFLIKKIAYVSSSLSVYPIDVDTWAIIPMYHNKYYSDIQLFRQQDNIVDTLQQQYPFIENVIIKSFNNNRIVLEPIFKEPPLVLLQVDKRFALYPHYILPLSTGDLLGRNSTLLHLPQYLSGAVSLSGFLYTQDVIELAHTVKRIYDINLSGSVTYMPGGEKFVYWTDRLHIYFNAKKWLSWQLEQLDILRERYPEFQKLIKIDIGSSDFPIVR